MGRPQTEETRAKISKSMTRRIIDVTVNEEFAYLLGVILGSIGWEKVE
jgi:hypothetical protein